MRISYYLNLFLEAVKKEFHTLHLELQGLIPGMVLIWILLIYIFPKKINLYTEIASDDNRANFTDLRAHWDHTLGYLVGLNKIY